MGQLAKTALKKIVKSAGIKYERYRILECPRGLRAVDGDLVVPVTSAVVEQAQTPELRATEWYGGTEARGFGILRNEELAAVCWYWFGERYKERDFIPLPLPAAKLVQITTALAHRGQGLAPALIIGSAQAMMADGFSPLYARVWHTNRPSLTAFHKVGWIERQMITVVKLPGISPWRMER